MSTETIVGQVRHTLTEPMIELPNNGRDGYVARAREGKFATEEYELVMAKDADSQPFTVDFANGDTIQATGAEIYDPQCLTVVRLGLLLLMLLYSVMTHQGIVPGLLERWYAERKELQAKARGEPR